MVVKRHARKCQMCGIDIPSQNTKYCSVECKSRARLGTSYKTVPGGSFRCPRCNNQRTQVRNGRQTVEGLYFRGRQCVSCGYRFSTIESEVTLL